MLPEIRLNGWGYCLPGDPVSNEALAGRLGVDRDLGAETGIAERYFSAPGEGPSGLAAIAAGPAMAKAGVAAEDLSMLVFATTTPDVAFPGSACFLQEKLSAPTVGALDLRAQSAGFVAALDMAAAFCEIPAAGTSPAPILLATAEVFSSCLDLSPSGAELASRLADGASVVVLSAGGAGPKLLSSRWYTDGTLLEKFWTAVPHSSQLGRRIDRADLAAGRHYPQSDLPALRGVAQARLIEVLREVSAETQTDLETAARVVIDYVEPQVAFAVARELGIAKDRVVIPTASFGHVMAAGLGIEFARSIDGLATGERMVLASAGPGFTWGAAVIEAD
jgi:3-oxoacyl-[acyl-carrier-protein] synthase-3